MYSLTGALPSSFCRLLTLPVTEGGQQEAQLGVLYSPDCGWAGVWQQRCVAEWIKTAMADWRNMVVAEWRMEANYEGLSHFSLLVPARDGVTSYCT